MENITVGKTDALVDIQDVTVDNDHSRFGRNSIETGYFIERVFPLYHTRFISVSDDFDTANFKGDTGGTKEKTTIMCPALEIDSSKDKLDLQTVQQAEHEEKLRAIQDSKRQLYEQYALGEIDLETYRSQKALYDAELVQAKNGPCRYYSTD